jgi:hypothetical protein
MLLNLLITGSLAVVFMGLAVRRWRGSTDKGWLHSLAIKLILFAIAFVLGEIYLIVLFADLKWPRPLAFVAITAWGILLVARGGSREMRDSGEARNKFK